MKKGSNRLEELLHGGIGKDGYRQIRGAVMECNRKALTAWCVSAAVFWVFMLVLAARSTAYSPGMPVSVAALAVSAALFVLARFPAARGETGTLVLTYAFKVMMLCAGIGIALLYPHDRTAVLIVVAVVVPISFIDRTVSNLLLVLLTVAVFAVAGKNVIDAEVYRWTLINLCVSSASGLVIGHVIDRERYERYLFADSAQKLAELQTEYAYHDQLTGMKNRRAYSEKTEQLKMEMPETLCVVMADLNGLKETNDTIGHEAGDELIMGTSECLGRAFEGIDSLYRVGGDEFCVLAEEPEEKVKQRLEDLARITAAWKGRWISGISISCGLASNRDDQDLESVIRKADQEMYEEKKEYYRRSGKDRRKR